MTLFSGDGFVDALWLACGTSRRERLGDDIVDVDSENDWSSIRDAQHFRMLIANAEGTGETAPWMSKGRE